MILLNQYTSRLLPNCLRAVTRPGCMRKIMIFVFLEKLLQRTIKTDVDALIEAFGKNEQVKKVSWTFFISKAGLILAQVLDQATAQ